MEKYFCETIQNKRAGFEASVITGRDAPKKAKLIELLVKNYFFK
jgi:hypothetical protein